MSKSCWMFLALLFLKCLNLFTSHSVMCVSPEASHCTVSETVQTE